MVTHQHRVLVTDALHDEVPHVVTDAVSVPISLAQQPLYPDRMRLTARSAGDQPFLRSNGAISPAMYSSARPRGPDRANRDANRVCNPANTSRRDST
ncbi:hypothetical protein GCM10010254_71110 [Streptomyces chromofuscus]|nr:hypothetical protein GCM10010254_71110 [Streptomyces chromofuscus]